LTSVSKTPAKNEVSVDMCLSAGIGGKVLVLKIGPIPAAEKASSA